jgi:hypothetical protein
LDLRDLTIGLLVYVLYPLWLAAGAVDYVCHRRTNIAETAGVVESSLHVAQFITMVILFVCAVIFEPTLAVITILAAVAILHLVLSYVDVVYTERKRYISPLEQHAHAFMDVLPIVAVCLLAILGLSAQQSEPGAAFRAQSASAVQLALLIGSFLVFAGGPVIEEFVRTASRAPRTQRAADLSILR